MNFLDTPTDELSSFRVEFFDTDRTGSPLPPFCKRAHCLGVFRGQLIYADVVVTQELVDDPPVLDKFLKASTLDLARQLLDAGQRTQPDA